MDQNTPPQQPSVNQAQPAVEPSVSSMESLPKEQAMVHHKNKVVAFVLVIVVLMLLGGVMLFMFMNNQSGIGTNEQVVIPPTTVPTQEASMVTPMLEEDNPDLVEVEDPTVDTTDLQADLNNL